jgi:hypothetical protein
MSKTPVAKSNDFRGIMQKLQNVSNGELQSEFLVPEGK